MNHVARDIARNARAMFEQAPPEEALNKAKLGILDTIGVTLAGSRHSASELLRKVVLPTAATGPVLVYGTGLRLNAVDAALINGTAAHMLDYDDSNSFLHGHASAAILPSLLAAAELHRRSGNDVMRAYITGFETVTRLGMGVSRHQYTHGWHPTATVGIFGGVVAAGLLSGLTEDQMVMALAITTSMAAGIKSNFGSPTKPLHVGQAARNGLFAVQLAHAGFTGREHAFDHASGYLNVFDRGPENYDAAKIVSDWGKPYSILDVGFRQKQFPCCYACLPPATAMITLLGSHDFARDAVERVEVAVHPIRFPHINNPQPKAALEAKFSVHYCMARLLTSGKLTIEDFEGDAYDDPATVQLMRRVVFSTHDKDNIHEADVRVILKDGHSFDISVQGALGGSYANPLPDAMVKEKFEDCAGRALDADSVAELYEQLRTLETISDITSLIALMQAPLVDKFVAARA